MEHSEKKFQSSNYSSARPFCSCDNPEENLSTQVVLFFSQISAWFEALCIFSKIVFPHSLSRVRRLRF